MERLTFEGNFCDIAMCRENPCPYNGTCSQKKTWTRLKEYEDTGYSPSDFNRLCRGMDETMRTATELMAFERLNELAQADKDGRLVVLPCKVGDTVYVVGECRIMKCDIDEGYLDDDAGCMFLVSFDCDNDCEGCPFNNWHQEYSGEYACDGEWGQASIKGTDFGKTVFLPREEAERALEGGDSASEETKVFDGKFHPWSWGALVDEAKKDLEG